MLSFYNETYQDNLSTQCTIDQSNNNINKKMKCININDAESAKNDLIKNLLRSRRFNSKNVSRSHYVYKVAQKQILNSKENHENRVINVESDTNHVT